MYSYQCPMFSYAKYSMPSPNIPSHPHILTIGDINNNDHRNTDLYNVYSVFKRMPTEAECENSATFGGGSVEGILETVDLIRPITAHFMW